MRRGMSYGTPYSAETREEDRGIVFIAYCSSLAEQYEVIQRWLNAGNATRVASSQNDPLTGVFPRNHKPVFRYVDELRDEEGGITYAVRRVTLEKPLTRLNWGEYFFVPSRTALNTIASFGPAPSLPGRAERGERVIGQIKALPLRVQQEEWKRLLEDYLTKDPVEHDITPLVWEAINARGGAYAVEAGIAADAGQDTPFERAILVTDEAEIMKVLSNTVVTDTKGQSHLECPYTSRELRRRMESHFGGIYVTYDQGSEYQREAYRTNEILMAYPLEAAVEKGFASGRRILERYKQVAEQRAVLLVEPPAFKIELVDQYIRHALADLCSVWFGIPDGVHFDAGGWEWNPPKPVCPGDFLSPSRHAFYPRPAKSIERFAALHGARLKAASKAYIDAHWDDPDGMPGDVTGPMHLHFRDDTESYPGQSVEDMKDLLRRNVIGTMIGALPPSDFNLRFVFFELFRQETFWRHQSDFKAAMEAASGDITNAYSSTLRTVREAMCKRPAPDLLYRHVQAEGAKIGNVVANKGDLVILVLSAATQARLRAGDPDVSVVFGGNRQPRSATTGPAEPLHACPARKMAMGAMTGIVAALFDAGRIQALPASLIVEVSDWEPAAGGTNA